MQKILFLILTAVLLGWAMPADAGKLYKWVDEDGKVHYTDTPPPESSKQERQVLNEQGMVTETLDRQKTPEEIAADAARAEALRKQEEAAEEKRQHDRTLLATYTNIEQIEMARDGRVNAIDSQIAVVGSTISNLEERLAQLEQQAAQIRNSGKDVPEKVAKQIESTRDELLQNQRYLLRKQGERQDTLDRFADDIQRYTELTGDGSL